MDLTLSSDVHATPGEVRDTKLMGELSGPTLFVGAGTVTGRFIVGDW